MADSDERRPLTITAREVNRVVVGHKLGASQWMRMSDEDKAGMIAAVRADAVGQLTALYPGHLSTFTDPQVEADGTGLTVAGDRTLDRGIVISCPVFVFEPVMPEGEEPPRPGSNDVAHELADIRQATGGHGFIGYCRCGVEIPGRNHRDVYIMMDAHIAADREKTSR